MATTGSQKAPIKIDWVSTIFLVTYHLLLFILLPIYLVNNSPSPILWWMAGGLMVFSLMSITAGYHRYFSHRTYDTARPIQALLLFFGTLATQGSVIRWSHDHRLHHRHVDGELDPYGTSKGFWHSHLIWMFKDGPEIEEKYIRDLKDDPMLAHQHNHYGWWMAIANILPVLVAGWLTGDWFGSFVIVFLLRLFVAHHCTWFINSLAHMWGSKPYSTEHSAVNNFFLASITYGEGYHNYHHSFAGDYRNGVRWYQFDPSKYLIWTLSKLGLAWGLQRMDPLMVRKKLVNHDKKLLIDHLSSVPDTEAGAFELAVTRMSEKISEQIASARALMDKYRKMDRKSNRLEMKEMRRHFRQLKRELSEDMKTWKRLCNLVLALKPATT